MHTPIHTSAFPGEGPCGHRQRRLPASCHSTMWAACTWFVLSIGGGHVDGFRRLSSVLRIFRTGFLVRAGCICRENVRRWGLLGSG